MNYANDHYVDKNNVLFNKLGISDAEELKRIESIIVAKNSIKLYMNPIQGNFDLAHLQEIHKQLFGEIYSWAGEIRDVDILKANVPFARSNRIIPEFSKLHKEINSENFSIRHSKEYVAERLAYYLGEINVIHPFREGNGRTQREFIKQLATHFGYTLDFNHISQAEMIEASMQSRVYADNELFTQMIKERLSEPELSQQKNMDMNSLSSEMQAKLMRAIGAITPATNNGLNTDFKQEDVSTPDKNINTYKFKP